MPRSFLFCLSYILANIVIGIPLIGGLTISLRKVLLILSGSMLTTIALCAIFTMINMLIQSKAIAPVVCIVAMFLSVAFVSEVQRILDEPQYYFKGTENEAYNNAYVGGAKREMLEFIYNALPAGQEMQYSRRNTENMDQMCLYSAGITVITSAVGVFFFKRKDIR